LPRLKADLAVYGYLGESDVDVEGVTRERARNLTQHLVSWRDPPHRWSTALPGECWGGWCGSPLPYSGRCPPRPIQVNNSARLPALDPAGNTGPWEPHGWSCKGEELADSLHCLPAEYHIIPSLTRPMWPVRPVPLLCLPTLEVEPRCNELLSATQLFPDSPAHRGRESFQSPTCNRHSRLSTWLLLVIAYPAAIVPQRVWLSSLDPRRRKPPRCTTAAVGLVVYIVIGRHRLLVLG
jgi:hypothetical protein